jgi:hypothetical protein
MTETTNSTSTPANGGGGGRPDEDSRALPPLRSDGRSTSGPTTSAWIAACGDEITRVSWSAPPT